MVLGHFQADYKIAKKHWQDGWKPVVRSFGPTHEDQDQETKSCKERTVGLSPTENLANEKTQHGMETFKRLDGSQP